MSLTRSECSTPVAAAGTALHGVCQSTLSFAFMVVVHIQYVYTGFVH